MTREEFQRQLPGLVKNYQPATDVLDKIKALSLLMVIGPSGVGKTTIINKLGLKYVISDTTRDRRPGEQEGVDFYFRKDYEQIVTELQSGQFLQAAADSGGDLKASKAAFYPNSGWIVMAIVTDVLSAMRALGFKQTISAFIVPPSYEEWMRRLKAHDLQGESLTKRLAEAKKSLHFALNDPEIHFILNDDIEQAMQQTKSLVEGKVDKKREQIARQAAAEILNKLN